MHELGWTWLWAALKAGVVFLAGSALYLAMRTRSPEVGSRLALASLLGATAALLLALAPWPCWYRLSWDGDAALPGGRARSGAPLAWPPERPTTGGRAERGPGREEARHPEIPSVPQPAFRPASLAAWLVCLAVAGSTLCALRLGLALRAVRHCCRGARTLQSQELLGLVEELGKAWGLRRQVRLAETGSLSTAAVVGWVKPQILLPLHWRSWSREERRVVLAHELAHLARGDFLAGIVAYACLMLNWYQPLAQWLFRRLRLEQEMAADQLAARHVGGVRAYLQALARLALAHDEKQIGWAMRPFLGRPSSLLRRIHMLRLSESRPTPSRGRYRFLVFAVILLGLLLAGVRGPVTQAAAQRAPVAAAAPPRKTYPASAKAADAAPATPQPDAKAAASETPDAEARRARSRENLLQIGLAMYNYHDVHGHFPPAVLIGPDGKTPHSWRVALLPYLAQDALHQQYRFDKPWDSQANLKVLAQMPEVFRAVDDPTSTATNYFVLTGPDTVFGKPRGTKIVDVTDGTSFTLMLVEAAADIPWTKPEDLAYDAQQPLPKLGGVFEGGFHVALCDGSVRFIPASVEARVLHAMITRAGGEVFEFP